MPTVKHTYPHPIESVWAMLTDPQWIKERSERMGERDIELDVEGSTFKNVRTVDAEVPSIAKKVLKPTNTVVEIKRWDETTRTGSLDVDIQGAPTKLKGDIRLIPRGDSTDFVMDYRAEVSIPLIGKKVAEYAEGVTARQMQEEFRLNEERLSGRS